MGSEMCIRDRVYPLGIAGSGNVLSFTPAMIEKVIYRGYEDELEEVFLYQMKMELIINQRRKSMGFANADERKRFFEQMQRENVKNGQKG